MRAVRLCARIFRGVYQNNDIPGTGRTGQNSSMKPLRNMSDREVYARLTSLSEELETLADRAWSVAGATALRAAARMVRAVSSGFFTGIGTYNPRNPDNPGG